MKKLFFLCYVFILFSVGCVNVAQPTLIIKMPNKHVEIKELSFRKDIGNKEETFYEFDTNVTLEVDNQSEKIYLDKYYTKLATFDENNKIKVVIDKRH